MNNKFDLLIIGAGPGGYVAAKKAAKLGMSVVIIEKGPIGGTCINRGCIPMKALLRASTLYREILGCGKYGLYADDAGYDLQDMIEYKNQATREMRENLEEEFKELGIQSVQGTATVMSGKQVRVTFEDGSSSFYFGNKILIATGSKERRLDIPGADLPGVMTSEALMTSGGNKYHSLIVLGGGVTGLETATVFRNLGAKVTIIEVSDHLIPRIDSEFSDELERLMRAHGVEIYKGSMSERITRDEEGVCCEFVCAEGTKRAHAEALLMSEGRIPNTDGLFAPEVPIKMDHGKILVDEFFRTSVPGIYAVGDVIGGIQLAHVASAQGTYVVEKMNDLTPSVIVSMVPSCLFTPISIVPSCLYTEPEIASVGLTETQAREKGVQIRVGRYDMKGNGQQIISRETGGFIKVIFAANSDVLLGAQIMCARATDMIGELATALANGLTSTQLMYAMRAHPTFNEAISCAVENSRDNIKE